MSDPQLRNSLYPPEFSSILELNPDLSDGSVLIFSEELPLELIVQSQETQNKVATIERIKINLFKKEEFGKSFSLKMQITSDSDLFLHFLLVITNQNYASISKNNDLKMNIEEFSTALLKLLNNYKVNPTGYMGSFLMRSDGTAVFQIYQNLNYKNIHMIELELYCADEETIRQNIAFRYSLLNAKNRFIEDKINEVVGVIKIKNPNLLVQLQKALLNAKK